MAAPGGAAARVRQLVAELENGTPAERAAAASSLRGLAGDPAGRVACMQAGATEPLVALLRAAPVYPDGPGVCAAAGALVSLAALQSGKRLVGVAKELLIQPILELLHAGTPKGRTEAAGALWCIALMSELVEAALLDADGMERLVTVLTAGPPEAVDEACGLIWSLCGKERGKTALVQAKGLPPLLQVLSNGSDTAREAAAGAIRLCATNDANKALLTRHGAVETLGRVLQNAPEKVKEQASGALKALWSTTLHPAATATDYSEQPPKADAFASESTTLGDFRRQFEAVSVSAAAAPSPAPVQPVQPAPTPMQADSEDALWNLRMGNTLEPSVAAPQGPAGGGTEGFSYLAQNGNGAAGAAGAANGIGYDSARMQEQLSQRQNATDFGADRSLIGSSLTELDEVVPLVELLQSGSEAEREAAAAALNGLAVDHQSALLEAGAVVPLVRLLDRVGHEAAIFNGTCDGAAVADCASVLQSLWRWGRPQEREQLERMAMATIEGIVQLLCVGSPKGKEQAAGALCALSNMSDSIKLAIAEAGAVQPLVKLLRTGSVACKEEAEGVLWTLLALNREQSQSMTVSLEAAADLVQLLATSAEMAREACGVLRNLVPANRQMLMQAGVVDGLIRVLGTAGSRCTGDGMAVSEAASCLALLARDDSRVASIAAGTVNGVVQLLERGTPTGREQAAGALWSLATINERVKVAIVEAGAVNLLIDLLGTTSTSRQADETTAGVLYALVSMSSRSLSFWDRYTDGKTALELRISVEAASGLVPLLNTGSELMREAAAGVLRLCAVNDYNKAAIMKARCVEPLVEILATGSEGAKEQAQGAILALCSFTGETRVEVLRCLSEAELLIRLLLDSVTANVRLAALLEQLVYDSFDLHICGGDSLAYCSAVYEAIGTLEELRSMRERGLEHWKGGKPLVDLLQNGWKELHAHATGGLQCLTTASKKDLIAAGCLKEMVDLCGPHVVDALVQLIMAAGRNPDGADAGAYSEALCSIILHVPTLAPKVVPAVEAMLPLLETGTPVGKQEAARALRWMSLVNDDIRVIIARAGAFAPLVELVGSGNQQCKEEACGCMYNLLVLMNECKIDVNLAVSAAKDISTLLGQASPAGREAAAGVMRLCAINEGNKINMMKTGGVEALVTALQHGNDGTKGQAGGAIEALASYRLSAPVVQPTPGPVAPLPSNSIEGWLGSFFSSSSSSAPAQPAVPMTTQANSGQSRIAEVRRLVGVLQTGPNHPIASVLERLMYDIYEDVLTPPEDEDILSAPPVGAVRPIDVAPQQQFPPGASVGAMDMPALAQGAKAVVDDPAPVTVPSVDADPLNLPAAPENLRPPPPPPARRGPSVRGPVAEDVKPLVQLLMSAGDDVKATALDALRNLNVQTHVAIIHAGALDPFVQLLGEGAVPALVTLLTQARQNPDGDNVGHSGHALATLCGQNRTLARPASTTVTSLVELLHTGTPTGKEEAAAALWSLSLVDETLKHAVTAAGAIEPMIKLIGAASNSGREDAAGVLWSLLTTSEPNQSSVVVRFTIENALDLVALLKDGSEVGKEAAAGNLRLLATSDINKSAIMRAQAVEPLVELLYASSEGIRHQCAGALRNLAVYAPEVYKTSRPELVKAANEVKRLVGLQLSAHTASPQYAALLEQLEYDIYDRAVRVVAPTMADKTDDADDTENWNSASVDFSPAHKINFARRIKLLIEMLQMAGPEQVSQVTGAFNCLTVHTKMAFFEAGCLYPMVQLLGTDSAQALVTMICEASKNQDGPGLAEYGGALSGLVSTDGNVAALSQRCILPLVQLLSVGTQAGQQEAAGALRCLSMVSFNIRVAIAEGGAFSPLVKLLGTGTQEGKEEAAGCLWRLLSMMAESNIEVNISVKKAGDLVSLLHTGSDKGKEAAAGALRLCAYNDGNKAAIMRARATEPLVQLLESPHEGVSEQAAGALRAVAEDKENRVNISEAAREVDTLVVLQMDASNRSEETGCLLEYLMYDIFDMRLEYMYGKTDADEAENGDSGAGALPADSGTPAATAGKPELARLRQRGRQLGGSREAKEGFVPLVQLLQMGDERKKQLVKGAFTVLTVRTKAALIEAGAVKPLVALLGPGAATALVYFLGRAVLSADGAGVGSGTTVGDLTSELVEAFTDLASGDERVASMVAGVSGVLPGLVQLIETGAPSGQEQAAAGLRNLCTIHPNLTIQIAREGAFEPLVRLLGTGTARAKEEAAGALWPLLAMMEQNNIAVNISVARATDLVHLLSTSSDMARQRAAAVLRLCATSDTNRANILRARAGQKLAELMLTGSNATQQQVAGAIVGLAQTSGQPDIAYASWLQDAAVQIERVCMFLRDGGCIEGGAEGDNLVVAGDDSAKGTVHTGGNQQVAAVLELLLYDMFYMRCAAGLMPELSGNNTLHDIYVQCADDDQVAFLRKVVVRMLLTGTDETKAAARDALQMFAVNSKVQLIEAGAAKALVELLGSGAVEALISVLDGSPSKTDGAGVVDTAVMLRDLANVDPTIQDRCLGAVHGVAILLENGTFPGGKEAASTGLWHLSCISDAMREAIAKSGSLPALVELLYNGQPTYKSDVAGLLWSISQYVPNGVLIIDAGAANGLVTLLHTGDEQGQRAAAGCIRQCAMDDSNKSALLLAKCVEPLVDALNLWNEELREEVAQALKALSQYKDTLPSLADAAVEVDKLVELRLLHGRLEKNVQLPSNSGKQHISALLERLIHDIFDMHREYMLGGTGATTAHQAVTAISASAAATIYGGAEDSAAVSKLPARVLEGASPEEQAAYEKRSDKGFPFIVQLLQMCSDEVQEQAAGAMHCLSVKSKAELIEAGVLDPMVRLLGSSCAPPLVQLIVAAGDVSAETVREAAAVAQYGAALAALAAQDPQVANATEMVIPPLVRLVEAGTQLQKEQAAAALRSVAGVNDGLKYAIAREGGFAPLVKLLGNGSVAAKEEAAGCLAILIKLMNESAVAVNLSPGPAGDLVALLKTGSSAAQTSASICIRLCAISPQNQTVLMSAGALSALVPLLRGAEPAVRNEALAALQALAVWSGREGDLWFSRAASEVERIGTLLTVGGYKGSEGAADANRQLEALLEQVSYDIFHVRATIEAGDVSEYWRDKVEQKAQALRADEAATAQAPTAAAGPSSVEDPIHDQERATQRRALLVELVHTGQEQTLRDAQPAVQALAIRTKVQLVEAGALRPLTGLIGSGLADALVQLLIKAGGSVDGAGATEYASALRTLAVQDSAVVETAARAVPFLIPLLEAGNMKGKEEAAGALWSLSTISESIKVAMAGAGAVEPLTRLLRTGSPFAKEEAAGALWSLSVVNEALKSQVAEVGAIEPLVNQLFNGTQSGKEEAAGALWSLSMNPQNTAEIISAGAAAGCVQLLYTGSEVGQESVAGTLALCGASDANKAAIMTARAVEPLVELLQTGSDTGREQGAAALKALATWEQPTSRQLTRAAFEVERLCALLRQTSGKEMIAQAQLEAIERTGGLNRTAKSKHPLAFVLEQLMYDVYDMQCAALNGAPAGFGLSARTAGMPTAPQPPQLSGPVKAEDGTWYEAGAWERGVRPLVDVLQQGTDELKTNVEGAMQCMSVNTKVAIVEAGALPQLVQLLGSGAAKAIVQLLSTAGSAPDGAGIEELADALCMLAMGEPRVHQMIALCIPGLVELLRTGTSAGVEQAAGAIWALRIVDPGIESSVQQSGEVERIVEVLGMGTAANRSTPKTLQALWGVLTTAEGTMPMVNGQTAADVVQLLFTGTDAGKQIAARVVRLASVNIGNRTALVRARVVEPLVEALQANNLKIRAESRGALLTLVDRPDGQQRGQQQSQGGGWFGSLFGGGGAAQSDDALAVSMACDEAVDLIMQLFEAQKFFDTGSGAGGNFSKQRKAAARLERLTYFQFHSNSGSIVM